MTVNSPLAGRWARPLATVVAIAGGQNQVAHCHTAPNANPPSQSRRSVDFPGAATIYGVTFQQEIRKLRTALPTVNVPILAVAV